EVNATTSATRSRRNALSKTQQHLKEFREFLSRKRPADVVKKPDYHKELLQLFSSANVTSRSDFLTSLVRTQKARLGTIQTYHNLAELYAEAMSSRPELGFKISRYADLVRPPVTTMISKLLLKPMSWFGDGEVSATCQFTKHLVEKTIWSPGLFSKGKYFTGEMCEW
uniref:Uncharacterized protein n=1 Tax=Ciona savignyi TaxID=51511 RepID=H2Z735_CIOSA